MDRWTVVVHEGERSEADERANNVNEGTARSRFAQLLAEGKDVDVRRAGSGDAEMRIVDGARARVLAAMQSDYEGVGDREVLGHEPKDLDLEELGMTGAHVERVFEYLAEQGLAERTSNVLPRFQLTQAGRMATLLDVENRELACDS